MPWCSWPTGTVVRAADQVAANAKLRVRVADGEFTATT